MDVGLSNKCVVHALCNLRNGAQTHDCCVLAQALVLIRIHIGWFFRKSWQRGSYWFWKRNGFGSHLFSESMDFWSQNFLNPRIFEPNDFLLIPFLNSTILEPQWFLKPLWFLCSCFISNDLRSFASILHPLFEFNDSWIQFLNQLMILEIPPGLVDDATATQQLHWQARKAWVCLATCRFHPTSTAWSCNDKSGMLLKADLNNAVLSTTSAPDGAYPVRPQNESSKSHRCNPQLMQNWYSLATWLVKNIIICHDTPYVFKYGLVYYIFINAMTFQDSTVRKSLHMEHMRRSWSSYSS